MPRGLALTTAAVAFGSFTLTAAQDATVGCPCISFPWAGSDQFLNVDTGMLTLSIMDDAGVLSEHPYPTSYGTDVCATHDRSLPPYCADADGVVSTKAPDFCGNKWCFVDPDSCDVTYETSSYFHQFPPILYYSYETCGAENTFHKSEYDQRDELAQIQADYSAFAFGPRLVLLDPEPFVQGLMHDRFHAVLPTRNRIVQAAKIVFILESRKKQNNHGRGMKSILQVCVRRFDAALKGLGDFMRLPVQPIQRTFLRRQWTRVIGSILHILLVAGPAMILHVDENGLRLDDSITLV